MRKNTQTTAAKAKFPPSGEPNYTLHFCGQTSISIWYVKHKLGTSCHKIHYSWPPFPGSTLWRFLYAERCIFTGETKSWRAGSIIASQTENTVKIKVRAARDWLPPRPRVPSCSHIEWECSPRLLWSYRLILAPEFSPSCMGFCFHTHRTCINKWASLPRGHVKSTLQNDSSQWHNQIVCSLLPPGPTALKASTTPLLLERACH